jgi:hypothetical protein
MPSDKGLRRVIAAIVGAVVSFFLVGACVFYWMANVRAQGFRGGPATLAAAMAALFGGGLVAVAVLIVMLRLLRER